MKGGKGSKPTREQVTKHNEGMKSKPAKPKTVKVASTRGGQVR